MAIILSMLVFAGGTVQLENGEIFEGKIVGETERKVYLQLEKGGVLALDKSRIKSVIGRPIDQKHYDKASGQASTPSDPDGKSPELIVKTVPAPAGDPRTKGRRAGNDVVARGKVASIRDETAGAIDDHKPNVVFRSVPLPADRFPGNRAIGFMCPLGFRLEEKGFEPPYVCALIEEHSGAHVTFRVQPFSEDLNEALALVRKEIGTELSAERNFPMKAGSGRLLEWRHKVERGALACTAVVIVDSGALFWISASVRSDLDPAYRDVFQQLFTTFKCSVPAEAKSPQEAPRAPETSTPPPPCPPRAEGAPEPAEGPMSSATQGP